MSHCSSSAGDSSKRLAKVRGDFVAANFGEATEDFELLLKTKPAIAKPTISEKIKTNGMNLERLEYEAAVGFFEPCLRPVGRTVFTCRTYAANFVQQDNFIQILTLNISCLSTTPIPACEMVLTHRVAQLSSALRFGKL